MKVLIVDKAPPAAMSGAFLQQQLNGLDAVLIVRPGTDLQQLAQLIAEQAKVKNENPAN